MTESKAELKSLKPDPSMGRISQRASKARLHVKQGKTPMVSVTLPKEPNIMIQRPDKFKSVNIDLKSVARERKIIEKFLSPAPSVSEPNTAKNVKLSLNSETRRKTDLTAFAQVLNILNVHQMFVFCILV